METLKELFSYAKNVRQVCCPHILLMELAYPACVLMDRFCISKRGGTCKVGGVTHRVTCILWLLQVAVEMPLVGRLDQFLPLWHKWS